MDDLLYSLRRFQGTFAFSVGRRFVSDPTFIFNDERPTHHSNAVHPVEAFTSLFPGARYVPTTRKKGVRANDYLVAISFMARTVERGPTWSLLRQPGWRVKDRD